MLSTVGVSPPPASRILIAETDPSILKALPRSLDTNIRDCQINLCSSRNRAIQMLARSQFDFVISNVTLAAMDDFRLLKRNGIAHPFTPFVVTATTAADVAPAREALAQGAFDVLTTPFTQKQVHECIRLIRWYQKLRNLMAIEEKAQDRYRQYLDASLADKKNEAIYKRSLGIVQETIAAYTKSLDRIEQSVKLFGTLVMHVRTQARQTALDRLHALGQSI